jgi:predicted RNase H-like nuclease
MDVFIGFDSAWTDNPKAPGAITAIGLQDGKLVHFDAPRLVSFDQAIAFIKERKAAHGLTLVALDQPTIVANATSLRPVERTVASLVSWLGGGVQPSNRGRIGMFCDASPIWRFLRALGAVEEPDLARTATEGLFLIEVFPALALASLECTFFGRLAGPRYNPQRRKTFRKADWARVAAVAARVLSELGSDDATAWCTRLATLESPRKADQDMLDAVLCLVVALRWRLKPRADSLVLGDLTNGYMVTPVSADVRERLSVAARKYAVRFDGVIA